MNDERATARYSGDAFNECAALSAALMGRNNGIEPRLFQDEKRRITARAILAVRASGKTVDPILVIESIRQAGHGEKANWPAFVGELLDAPALPSATDVLNYHARLADLDDLGERIHGRTRSPSGGGDVAATIEEIERDIGDALKKAETSSQKLTPISIGSYDPSEKVPVLCGDEDSDIGVAEGDLVLEVGEVEGGKTLSILDLGIAAAFGQPWLGFPIRSQRKVMIVLADGDGERPVQRRAVRLAQGRNLRPIDLDTCGRFRTFVPDAFNLDNPRAFLELQRELSDYDPDLFAIETISSLMGSERNAWHQSSVADFIATRLRPLQKRPDGTRRTVVIGAHLTKQRQEPGGGRQKDRVAGSYYVLGGVDAAIGLEPAGPESFKVRVLKRSRWGCSFRPFLAVVTGQQDEPLKLINNGPLKENSSERSASEKEVMAGFASLNGPDGWIPLAEVKRHLGAERNTTKAKTIDRASDRLVERGDLERKGDKRVYRLKQNTIPNE